MTKFRSLVLFGVLAMSLLVSAESAAQLSVSNYSIDGGGGFSVGGNFEIFTVIGETDGGPVLSSGEFELSGGFRVTRIPTVLLGDVNQDGIVNLLDVGPFIDLLSIGGFSAEADTNQDGVLNLLDVEPFIAILSGN